jgi:hypothetical protein
MHIVSFWCILLVKVVSVYAFNLQSDVQTWHLFSTIRGGPNHKLLEVKRLFLG